MSQALGSTNAEKLLEECAVRLYAAGIPLWRANLSFRILHPLYEAVSLVWYRETGLQEMEKFVSSEPSVTWRQSPLSFLVDNELPFVRRRLTGPEAQLDFPLLTDLRDQGATDYLGYLVPFRSDEFGTVGRTAWSARGLATGPAGLVISTFSR